MTDPATLAGYKVGTMVSMAAGASVAGLLMSGPWHLRLMAGAVGALFAAVGTPLFSPLIEAALAAMYSAAHVDASRIPADSVAGFTGFILGLTGIDVCRWIVDRTKGGLKRLRLPFPRGRPPD